MKTRWWKPEAKGPGHAYHMFIDAGGERIELLAYDCPASHGCPRMCGFEVYGRLRKGGPFHKQIAAGEADTIQDAMDGAFRMIGQPREAWSVLSRSWVT